MITFQDRVALVTGGSKGLGAELVSLLASLGAEVAFTYSQDDAAAAKLVECIQQTGRRCISIRADAKDFARAHEVVAETCKTLGGLHVLVCCAGLSRSDPIWKMSEEDWDVVVDVCLKGNFNYIRAAAPIFMEQQYGKIVSIGSINGLRGRLGTVSYNAAKAGLVGLIKSVAAELGRFNVNANLVAPGFIESEARTPELIRDLVLKECAIKRLGEPADIVPLVAFLCSDAARHITGQTIKVDAGQYL